jgi:predicted Rdx family selenoprotein
MFVKRTSQKKFAQELLSTFSTSLGEVALVPTTGGIFTVTIYHHDHQEEDRPSVTDDQQNLTTKETVLWDRKTDGGFPGRSSAFLSVSFCP